ncbi:YqiA/YcfP family alpha/beta fold hydrolase [Thiomicrospira microaerophila]|uniref:YqiA/YcfP family alpha/beta fold hydrolase n=1 Tax=Thiomicrospira microaerophila TaxID=406020 RepID=UPI000695DA1B|nr:YqiA/YcfP family alpha/beta fold hydrolase [Thiomicrospira microaerophila]
MSGLHKPVLIVYIHGYGSTGLSTKARHYQQLFGKHRVLAPSLAKDSRLSVDTLNQTLGLLSPYYQIGLIGSSLGGYLAIYFAERFQLPAVLINPAIPPWHQGCKQSIPSPLDASEAFSWQAEHFKRLAPYRVETLSANLKSRLLLLQQLDDEVLDAQLALDYLADVQTYTSQGGGHRFVNIANYDQQVCGFFQSFWPDMLK